MNDQRPQTGPFNVGDRILDKFEVRGLLGKGGHAFVYDCFNAFLAEEVAIKVIPNLIHRGNQLFNRARGEAQVLYRLNHPHVVRVMDGGEVDGMAYIVMEKLEGMTLRAMLSKIGPLTVYEALTIALQVAEALEAAHAMNVVHRDLKPDNIFLLAENHVKVLDFGIAKFLEGGYQTTQKDLIQGTAPYMSPEQAQGHGVTFASDIFQLGVVMYEMIAGLCPCMVGVEEPPSPQIIVAMQISKLPPRLKSIVPAVPSYVDRLIWRALAKEARQRFPVMQEFTDAIRAALDRMRAELPPQDLTVRAVRGNRTPAHAPRHDSRSPAVPRTTPIALVTPKPNRADIAGPVVARSFDPASGGLAAQKPAADPRAARRLFTGALLIGAALALPIGLGIVFFKRGHAHPSETTAATSAEAAPLPPTAKPVQPSSHPSPMAPPPSVVPAPPATQPTIEPIARAAPVATTTPAKSPINPIPRVLPASVLISDSAKRTLSTPLAPKPDAAPSSSKPMPKLIF